ncbi:O-antigen polysaccharide polymerase Wzy [Ruminococcus sp. OM05-10BH]|nr:O-antigen polysaccharide polymerase Wzy [Ruminococcus sp. OM05-10BH]
MIKTSNIIAFLFESILLGISLVIGVDWKFIVTVMLWSIIFIYSLYRFEERTVLAAFMSTFFMFLLGAYVCNQYLGYSNNVVVFDTYITNHIYNALNIALLGIWIGFLILEKVERKGKRANISSSEDYIKIVRQVSKYGFYLLYVPYLVVLIERIRYSNSRGYNEIYLGYSSSMPYLIRLLANAAPMLLFIFLSTLPSKKECKLSLFLYLLYLFLNLGTGERAEFVIGFLIILIYFFFRNKSLTNEERWIGKKEIITLIILAPIALILLNIYGYIRFGEQYENTGGFLTSILDIFTSQGVSISVIGYEKMYENVIPENKLYSFGTIIDFLKYNPISSVLFDFVEYTGQNAERAINGNSMAHIISYLVLPYNYSLGRGLGSSYIAELYHDFGYIGVFLGNIIYGIVIKVCSSFNKYQIWIRYVCLVMINAILLAPRSTADGFLSSLTGMEVWLSGLLVWVISKSIYKRHYI